MTTVLVDECHGCGAQHIEAELDDDLAGYAYCPECGQAMVLEGE